MRWGVLWPHLRKPPSSRVFVVSPGIAHNLGIVRASTIRDKKPGRSGAAVHAPQPTDLRLGHIVRLLMEHATVVVSGTKIAEEISSSRSEVWRLIQQLRSLGVDVAGHSCDGISTALGSRPSPAGDSAAIAAQHHFRRASSSLLQDRVHQHRCDGRRGRRRSGRQRLPCGRTNRRSRARSQFMAITALDRNLLFGRASVRHCRRQMYWLFLLPPAWPCSLPYRMSIRV